MSIYDLKKRFTQILGLYDLPYQLTLADRQRFHIARTGLLLVFMGIPYFPIFLFFKLYTPAFVVIPLILLFCISIYINYRYSSQIAGIIQISTTSLGILYYGAVLGAASGAHFMYFAMVSLPSVFFGNKKSVTLLFGYLIPIVSFIFLTQFLHENFNPLNLSIVIKKILLITISLTSFVIIIGATNFFSKAAYKLDEDIREMYLRLQKKDKLLSAEYEMAKKHQKEFLPAEMPKVNGYNISSYYKGSRGVSGDFFDYHCFNHITKFIIADVKSKGLSAAFITVHLYSIFRNLISANNSPSEILTIINKAFVKGRHDYEKAAAFVFDLDSKLNMIKYSNACIGVAYFISNRNITELEYCGFMTGGDANEIYEEKEMTMRPGDILLIASDGLEDFKLNDGTRFGHKKLIEVITLYLTQNHKKSSIKDFIVDYIQSIANFDSILEDDIVILCVERLN